MTDMASIGKKLPRYNYYPKSSTKAVAKIDMKPRRFRSQFERVDYFALGDSFVNMFLHAQNTFFIKIKGKSLKGLAKCDNQERKYIEEWVDAMPSSCQVIFNFGQVDLNFVRYYKLAHNEMYPDETFQEYVEWISSLSRECIVLGILACPIKEQNVYEVLSKYNTLQGVIIEQNLIKKQHQRTEQVRKRWNGHIQKACKKYGVRFINVFDYNKPLDSKFIDQNPLTVHLRYLPTMIEVQKKLPRISINIKKSLQIQEEYVTEKTSRYYKNLELLQERKRLESIESQQTKTEINSSRDATEQDEKELQKQDTGIVSKNTFLDEDETLQETCGKKQCQSLLDEINFDEAEYEDFSHVTPELLLKEMTLRQNVTSYCTDTFLYHIGRLLDNENSEQTIEIDNLVSKFLSAMIDYGIDSIDTENQSCEPTWMLQKIQSLTTMVLTKQGQQRLTKSFVRCLQQLFEKSLTHKQDKSANSKITIPSVVRFIISIFENQSQFQFALIKEKLILRIIQQIFSSLVDHLLEQKVFQPTLNLYTKSISIIRKDLSQFRQKILISKLEKNKLTEEKLCFKFQSIFQHANTKNEESVKQVKEEFTHLLYQKYPFAVCSQKVLSLMLGQITKKRLLFELIPLVNSVQIKLKQVQIDPTFEKKLLEINQQFTKKIEQIENKQKQHNHKQKDHNDKCCRCGCLLAMTELLKKPQKTKGKSTKLNQDKSIV